MFTKKNKKDTEIAAIIFTFLGKVCTAIGDGLNDAAKGMGEMLDGKKSKKLK